MYRVRGGSGLGDSIYLRPVVDHLIANRKQVTVMSFHPDVFTGTGATVIPVNKAAKVDMIAHYTTARFNQTSTQWDDIRRSGNLPVDLPLRFNWPVRNTALVEHLKDQAAGEPIILVHGGRAPFGRTDGYGKSLMPQQSAFQAVLDAFPDCMTVRIGMGKQYPLSVDLDMTGQTTVSDMLDMATICDGVITQCGFPVPMAECFDKPVLALWSQRGLACGDKIIASVTPAKICCKPTSTWTRDDYSNDKLHEHARYWRSEYVEKVTLAA